MTTYWVLYLIPSICLLTPFRGSRQLQGLAWVLIWTGFTLAIGLRHEVGCDWGIYLDIFNETMLLPFPGVQGGMDPGYGVLNWLVTVLDGEIYWVNLFCGGVFSAGVIIFARRQPYPWLAITVLVPYLLIVVAMGYTRQSVALGLIFWGLTRLADGRFFSYLLLIAVAGLFHKSALLMLPLGVLASSQHKVAKLFAIVAVGVLLGVLLLLEYSSVFWNQYVEASLESEGGAIRVWMNVLPTVLMLLYWRRWRETFHDHQVWFWIGMLALVCVPLVSTASTAVDRIALYFSPIQVAVFSRMPALAKSSVTRTVLVLGFLGYYGTVLWVWLNLGIHSKLCWIPYQTPWF